MRAWGNPKPEGRNPKEVRNPKSEKAIRVSLIHGTFGAEAERGLHGDPDAILTHYKPSPFFNLAGVAGWRRRGSCIASWELTGKKDIEVDPLTVMLFESDLGWNGCGCAGAMKPHKHSSKSVNVALADGSVKAVARLHLKTLRWDP
jgi:prepilin-type processing-associated H-X9-DG protein